MAMDLSDPIIAPSRGTAAQLIAFMDQPDAKDTAYANALFKWAAVAGVDFSIAATQFAIETDNGTSPRWNTDLNAAGIGIPLDTTAQPWKIPDGEAAARLHIQCLYALVTHTRHGGIPLWPQADTWLSDVWLARMDDPAFPNVRTVADLNIRYTGADGEPRATWAWDATYANQFPPKAQKIFGTLPDSGKKDPSTMTIPTKHSVPTPPIYDLSTDYARYGISRAQATEIINSRFENRSGAEPRFIVCHIQDGVTTGSLHYWASSAVDASSTVMIQKDGSILHVVPEQHGPWTNGDVNRPTAQANEILALGGNPNIWSLTMESEGDASNQLTDAQTQAVIWQIEDWLMRYPKIVQAAWCMLEHAYINSVDRAFCGLYLYGAGVVDAINAWLDSANVPAKPTPPAKPEPPKSPYPKGMTEQLARVLYLAQGEVKVPWASKPFPFDLARSECRHWLASHAAKLKAGAPYTDTNWPALVDVRRRGDGKTRVFVFSDGSVYEQVTKGQ